MERFCLPTGNLEYHAYSAGDAITLRGLGVTITVADIYYGVVFE